MTPILLATTSKYKIKLFQRLGLTFESAAPPFEEFIDPSISPDRLAGRLASGKAHSLAEAYPHHLIIGADQILELEDEIFTKPGNTEQAVAQLLKLSGKTHCLFTAFTLFEPATGEEITEVVTARLTFHDRFSAEFLKRLVAREQSQDCVGGYKFESEGFLLVKRVETEDANSIVGLPLIALVAALSRFGYFTDRFISDRSNAGLH